MLLFCAALSFFPAGCLRDTPFTSINIKSNRNCEGDIECQSSSVGDAKHKKILMQTCWKRWSFWEIQPEVINWALSKNKHLFESVSRGEFFFIDWIILSTHNCADWPFLIRHLPFIHLWIIQRWTRPWWYIKKLSHHKKGFYYVCVRDVE